MKIIVDNSTPEGRQRALEARVQIGFADVAGKVLEFLASGEPNGFVCAMRAFADLHDLAEAESSDTKGIAIRTPNLERKLYALDENDPINTILRGSLRMVAAMAAEAARRAGAETMGADVTDSTAYKTAQDEILEGIALLEAKVKGK